MLFAKTAIPQRPPLYWTVTSARPSLSLTEAMMLPPSFCPVTTETDPSLLEYEATETV